MVVLLVTLGWYLSFGADYTIGTRQGALGWVLIVRSGFCQDGFGQDDPDKTVPGGPMQRVAWQVFFVGLLLSAVAVGQSQTGDSLGGVARANHAQPQAQGATGTTPRVITNQDLTSDPPGVPEFLEPMTTVSGVKRSADSYWEQRGNQRRVAEQRAGEQWKARIEDQEARIDDLPTRINRVSELATGRAQYDTPVNRYHSIQMERLVHMRETMDQQQRRLSMMQDAARLTGMGQ
jgi:hypothetical protein